MLPSPSPVISEEKINLVPPVDAARARAPHFWLPSDRVARDHSSLGRYDLVTFVMDHDVVIRSERIMLVFAERLLVALTFMT